MPDQLEPSAPDDAPDAEDVVDDSTTPDESAPDAEPDDGTSTAEAEAVPDEAPNTPPPLTRSELGGGSADRSKLGPIVLGAVALLMVGFILGRVTSDSDGTAETPTTTTAAALQFPSGDQDRSGYWGFGGVTPAVSDTFDRDDADDGLGTADSGGDWTPVSGSWGISDHTAAGEAGQGEAGITVIPGGNADRLTEATATVVEDGAGIVFRFRDRDNYWSMTADPAVGIWRINRVLDGESTVAAEVPGATADGTTVTIAQRGTELQILVEGVEALRITDGALAGQTRSGLIVPGDGDGSARFDRFYVGNMPA